MRDWKTALSKRHISKLNRAGDLGEVLGVTEAHQCLWFNLPLAGCFPYWCFSTVMNNYALKSFVKIIPHHFDSILLNIIMRSKRAATSVNSCYILLSLQIGPMWGCWPALGHLYPTVPPSADYLFFFAGLKKHEYFYVTIRKDKYRVSYVNRY